MHRQRHSRSLVWIGALALVVWSVMAAGAGGGHAQSLPVLTIRGVVKNLFGRAVPRAFVSTEAVTVVTDARGRYVLHAPLANPLFVAAWAAGYQRMTLYARGADGRTPVAVNFVGAFALQRARVNAAAHAYLSGLPIEIGPGSRTLRLHGRSARRLEAKVAVTDPRGDVRFFPLHAHGDLFRARIRLSARGPYWVEINATSGFAVFNVLVFHDVRPSPPPVPNFPPDPGHATGPELESFALYLINEERLGAGRPGLEILPAVQRAAVGHNSDVLRYGYFARHPHIGEAGSTPPRRIAVAGFHARATGEAIGRGASVGEIVIDFLESPVHRYVLLGNYRWAGIAISPTGGQLLMTVDLAR